MKYIFTLLLFQIIAFQFATSQVITIGATGNYPNLEAAESFITAGDTLLLLSQTFTDGAQFLENINGTELMPVVIMAQNEHESIFQGGTEAIHLINCSYVEINGLVIEQQTGNGINIDDGGDYSTPSQYITIRNCIFRDMAAGGNNDLLKMSGVDNFLIEQCQFIDGGAGGSGVDFVGCHWGTVQDCYFDNPGVTGIQNKGGTQYIRMQRNIFKNVAQRAINLGGSTGLEFFRPPLPDLIVDAFEAADLEVYSNVFIGCWAPIAYVGCVRVKVYNNTFYQPENWVIRILQETTTPGFLTCSNSEFSNNIVYLPSDITEVNIGPNTAPETFTFSNNLWFNASNDGWLPVLPVTDANQVIANPLFEDTLNENFNISSSSPAVGAGLILTEPSTDFNQVSFQEPPSIGAFEGNNVSTPNIIRVHASVQLQGAYDTDINLMKTDLLNANLIPLAQVFNTSPWNYAGTESMAELSSFPGNTVDWILLELRAGTNGNVLVEQRAALLLADGNIVDVEDFGGVRFYSTNSSENYYLVVRARNHLAIMSNVAYDFPNSDVINLSNPNNVLEGFSQLASISPTVQALYCGDYDNDGVITVNDFNRYKEALAAVNVYTQADGSMDGNVTVNDFNLYQPNASIIGVQQVRYE